MIRLVVVLLAVILLHGVHSHIFPKQLQELAKSMQPLKQIKRQDFNINEECATEKSTKLSSACLGRIAATGNISDFDNIASLICSPECGQAFLDIIRDCGGNSAEVRILASLCGTNSNGIACYNFLNDFEQLNNESDDDVCPSITTCPSTCQSLFSQLFSRQGCCFDVFLNIVRLVEPGIIEPFDSLLDTCDIDVPPGCNNSPISGRTTIFEVSCSAILSALALVTVLG